jgi:methyl-accepting chemotaxis protein
MNCWEYMLCGREEGGDNVDEEGVCPAYPKYGKKCAFIVGTLCKGEVQGTYAQKLKNCTICPFYKSEFFEP